MKTLIDKLAQDWAKIKKLDREIEKTRPWELENNELEESLENAVTIIRDIGYNLKPFLPETAEKIEKQFSGPKIKSGKPLFPRLA